MALVIHMIQVSLRHCPRAASTNGGGARGACDVQPIGVDTVGRGQQSLGADNKQSPFEGKEGTNKLDPTRGGRNNHW